MRRARTSARRVILSIVAHMSTPTPQTPLSLDGIRVVDLSRVLAGPYCGALLGDLGADVIKVEDPGAGDESRTWPPHKDGESAGYLVNNRNKRGIAVNLKEPDGVTLVRRLAATADVLIENFRTGTMEEFGLGYETLARENPRLVYCSVSAFGRTGPRAEGSLLETALGLLNFQAEGFLLAGTIPKALGSAHPSLSPYRNFRCRDEQWVFIAGANDRLWRRLAGALGLGDMADDPRFATNVERVKHRAELEQRVGQAIAEHDRETLLKLLEKADVPATPVNTVDQVLNDPQTATRPTIRRVVHPKLGEIPVVGMPLSFSAMTPGVRRHAPMRGEHTDEILAECGYSAAQIADLRARKVVA